MFIPPFRTEQLAQQVAVQSAINPSLWAGVVFSIPLFFLASNTNGWISIASFIVALIPIIVFAFSYIYFLITNPDYLRSESFQLRMNSIRLLGDKDNPMKAHADDIVTLINNPKLPQPKIK
jgi:hypothetical protein